MVKALICPICGRTFVTILPNQKYCGCICADAGRRQRRAKWVTMNPHYSTAYMRSYRAAKREIEKREETT